MTKDDKKPKKPKKDKKVAWTQTKQNVLRQLLEERVWVEQNPERINDWGLATTWLGIINSHVTDAIKQSVLNDLLDDKVAYLQSLQAANTIENVSLQDTIDQGLALKE